MITVQFFTAEFPAKQGHGCQYTAAIVFYYLNRICALFRSTPKHGISGLNLPMNLISTAFIFFITLSRTLQKHNFEKLYSKNYSWTLFQKKIHFLILFTDLILCLSRVRLAILIVFQILI